MEPPRQPLRRICSLLYLMQLSYDVVGTQFASHVSINTPARSISHGVGDPVSVLDQRAFQRFPPNQSFRRLQRPHTQGQGGYPRHKPAIPFQVEEVQHGNSIRPWSYDSNFMAMPIPMLPPSPYKVDSPDPESLWPIGLFMPPIVPLRFGSHRRLDYTTGTEIEDPYLLEGSDAMAAIIKSFRHGQLYFHDIPHIESLLANQELRAQNNLKPHRIASIRQTWPFNRP